MEPRRLTQDQFEDLKNNVPADKSLVLFKLVNIGPNTIASCKNEAGRIVAIADRQPGHYIVADNVDDLRKSLHELADKFCDIVEKL
jgi:hypothetical protein